MAYFLEELLPEFRKGAKIREWNWDKGHYIYLRNKNIYNECGEIIPYRLNGCSDWFLSDKWEIYNDPELDWQYIIDNKCLCWFWDSLADDKKVDFLIEYNEVPRYSFSTKFSRYVYCRPLSKDEGTFYEDREND